VSARFKQYRNHALSYVGEELLLRLGNPAPHPGILGAIAEGSLLGLTAKRF